MQARKSVQHIGWQVQSLADLAGGAAAAIGDDRACHGGAVTAVASVDFLDDPFAALTTREINVDVGPALAAFRQEALEEHVELERIDGCDSQTKADRAVGGAAASLREDAFVAAEADDVGDDKKVAGETEASDEGQFLL